MSRWLNSVHTHSRWDAYLWQHTSRLFRLRLICLLRKSIKEQPVSPKSKEMQSWQQKPRDNGHDLGKSLPVDQQSHKCSGSIFPLGGFWYKKSESGGAGYGKVEAPRWLLYRTRCWYHNQTSQLYTCESMLVQLIRRWLTRHSNLGITDIDKSKTGADFSINSIPWVVLSVQL